MSVSETFGGDVRIICDEETAPVVESELAVASLAFVGELRNRHPFLHNMLRSYPDDNCLVPDPYTIRPYREAGLIQSFEPPYDPTYFHPKHIRMQGSALTDAVLTGSNHRFFGRTVRHRGELTTTPCNDEAGNPTDDRESIHIDTGKDLEWRLGWNCGDTDDLDWQGDRSLLALTHSPELLGEILGTDIRSTRELRQALQENKRMLGKIGCLFIPMKNRWSYVACTGKKGIAHDASSIDTTGSREVSVSDARERLPGSIIQFKELPIPAM